MSEFKDYPHNWEKLYCLGMMVSERLKIEGGYLYITSKDNNLAVTFVPYNQDIDIQKIKREEYCRGFIEGSLSVRGTNCALSEQLNKK